MCRNRNLSACTWVGPHEGRQCFACDLTRTRPNDEDVKGIAQFVLAEQAKRHLVVNLDTLGFPIRTKHEDPENGLCFDLLSSVGENVTTDHHNGVITIDPTESDDAYPERCAPS